MFRFIVSHNDSQEIECKESNKKIWLFQKLNKTIWSRTYRPSQYLLTEDKWFYIYILIREWQSLPYKKGCKYWKSNHKKNQKGMKS